MTKPLVLPCRAIKIDKIAAGDNFVLCLSIKGKVYAFGECLKFTSFRSYLINIDDEIQYIFCGGYHSLLLSKNNELYVFGDNKYNQCSNIIKNEEIPIFTPYKFMQFMEDPHKERVHNSVHSSIQYEIFPQNQGSLIRHH